MPEADSISLHTIGGASPGIACEGGPSLYASSETDKTRGNDDIEVPVAFFDNKVLLESPPVYYKNEKYTSRFGWISKEDIQGRYGPICILLCLWATVLSNQWLASMSISNSETAHWKWAPGVMTMSLLLFTRWSVSTQLHRIQQQPRSAKTSEDFQTHLWVALIFVSCCAGPILGISLNDAMTFAKRDIQPSDDVSVDYVQLQSWKQIALNLNAFPPFLEDKSGEKEPWARTYASSADTWMVGNDKIKAVLPEYVNFSLPRAGKGKGEEHWNGESSRNSVGLYMPSLPINGPMDWKVFSTTWEIETQVLGFSLQCEYISPGLPTIIETRDELSTISVNVTDSDGCSGTIAMPGFNASNMHNSLKRTLYLLEQEAYRGTASPDAIDLIESYRELLFAHKSLVAYQPTWVRPTQMQVGSQCKTRLLVAGLGQAFLPVETVPDKAKIQAASCQGRYGVRNITMLHTRTQRSRYHQRRSFTSRNFSVTSDRLEIKTLDKFIEAAQDPSKWSSLSIKDTNILNEVFVAQAGKFLNASSTWKLAQLRAEFEDVYWKRRNPVGPLLVAGQYLSNDFVARMSIAAELTLQENIPNLPFERSQRVQIQRVERSILQKRLSYKICLVLVISLITTHLCYLQGLCLKNYKDDFRVPWDTSSVAARIALLRFSQAGQWFHSMKAHGANMGEAPEMSIGHWAVHEEDGNSGLRVEYLQSNTHKPKPPNDYRGWNSNNRESIPWLRKDQDDPTGVSLFLHWLFQIPILCTWMGWAWACENLSTSKADAEDNKHLRLAYLSLDGAAMSVEVSWIWMLITMLIPTGVTFVVANCSAPKIYNFFVFRQPWISLRSPQLAHLGLTLDYWNSICPILKALRNRHLRVATLAAIVSLGSLAPLIYSRAWYMEWRMEPLGAIKTGSAVVWREDPILLDPTSQKSFDLALKDTFESLTTSQYKYRWSSQNVSMLPLHLDDLDSRNTPSYWTLNSSVIIPGLECKAAAVKLATTTYQNPSKDSYHVQSMSIEVPFADNLLEASLVGPCDGQDWHDNVSTPPENQENGSRQVVCSRWWLHNTTDVASNYNERYWALAIIYGQGYWSHEAIGMLFNSKPQAIGLLCHPVIRREAGTITLMSDDSKLANAVPVRYKTLQAEGNLKQLAQAISAGLHTSVGQPYGTYQRATVADALLSTHHFVGDLLSYMLYRLAYAGNVASLNSTSLAADASTIFSSYVSMLAEKTNLLSMRASEGVTIQAFGLNNYIRISRIAVLMVPISCFLGMIVVWICNYSSRDFSLPFAPEQLLNGLLLVCDSSLVQKFEEEIPCPEKLSLRQFYRQIEHWGEKYKLGKADKEGSIMLTVDVNSVFEEAQSTRRRYEDDVDSESDSDSDSDSHSRS